MAELEIALECWLHCPRAYGAIAHLIVMLAVPVVVGLVFLVRRARRPNRTRKGQRTSEEEH
jgi:hypothetical protein